MRQTTVIHVVDARRTQERVIVHLECRHNISLTNRIDAHLIPAPAVGDGFNCPICADPKPPTALEVMRGKSPQQLWKEAGQP